MTRAVLVLEDIGWGGTDKYGALRPGRSARPWVARLTAYDDAEGTLVFGRFAREFVRGQRDFSRTNRSGSRGVFLYYALKPGIYEVNERNSWTNARRYFCRVDANGAMTEITREEAITCLPDHFSQSSADLASPS